MNYDELSRAVRAYVENEFPETVGAGGMTSKQQIDTFIMQAEQRIFNTVQLLDLRKNVTGNCTAGNKYLTVPDDWLSNFSIAVIDPVSGDYRYLYNKDVNYLREAFPNPMELGKPTHYAFFDKDSYILAPTPDVDYQMELHYFYYPESITTANDTWLGTHFDSVLLYGSILEAHAFMKGEEDTAKDYRSRYEEALGLLKQLGEGKLRQDQYRSGQVRYPVK